MTGTAASAPMFCEQSCRPTSPSAGTREQDRGPSPERVKIVAPPPLGLPPPLLWPQLPRTTSADGTKEDISASMPVRAHLKPRRRYVARAFYPAAPPAAVERGEQA